MDGYKRILCLLFTFSIGINSTITAQSISRSVLSAGGKSTTNASGSLISNIGELSVSAYASSTNYITEGFVQPFYFITVSVPDLPVAIKTGLYPNPASDHVFISIPVDGPSCMVEIYDIQGRVLPRDNTLRQVSASVFMLDIASLASGVYFVRLVDTRVNESVANIKLLKE